MRLKLPLILAMMAWLALAAVGCGKPAGYDQAKQNALAAQGFAQAANAAEKCDKEYESAEAAMAKALHADSVEDWKEAMLYFSEAENLYNLAKFCALQPMVPIVLEPAAVGPKVFAAVFFDFNMSVLRSGEQMKLAEVAKQIRAGDPQVRYRLTGYADVRGSIPYNMALSGARARAVYDYLVAQGIVAESLAIVAGGKTAIFGVGKSEAEYQENRRVVIEPVQ